MKDFDAASFGHYFAHLYGAQPMDGTDVTVDLLTELAKVGGGGRVLELGIGTGRIGLALKVRGLDVHGVELSPEMVAELRRRPGGADLPVIVGDMSEVEPDGEFSLICIVHNSLTNVADQEAQLRTVVNAGRHLTPGGLFVVDGFLPTKNNRWPERQRVAAEVVEPEYVQFEVELHDPSRQRIEKTHLAFTPAGQKFYPTVHRYVWPSELDLMAKIAGLELVDRWQDWRRAPFGADSEDYVCVYRRP